MNPRNLHKAKQSAIMMYIEERKEYTPIAYCINSAIAKHMSLRLNIGTQVFDDVENAIERVISNKEEE